MITLELTEEDIGTLIEALGDFMEQSGLNDTEWLRRQDMGADLDMDLREALNRADDGWPTRANPHAAQAIDNERSQNKGSQDSLSGRMMKGTATPVIADFESLIANDPADW